MQKKHLIIKIIVIVIVVFFIVYNGIWFYCYSIYKPFMDAVGKDEYGRYAYMDADKITYYVAPPKYLTEFYGNLAISDFRKSDLQSEDILVDMIIWPSVKGTYEVGIMLQITENTETNGDKNSGSYSVTTKSMSFELDEHMNFLKEYSKEDKQLFEENRETIKSYYQKAYDMWGILGNP